MITVIASAQCAVCPWSAGPGDWPEVDKAAEKHTKAEKHPTCTHAGPASPQTSAASPAAAAQEGTT